MRSFFTLSGALVGIVLMLPLAQAGSLEKEGSISATNLKESKYPDTAKIDLKEAVDAALEKQKGKAVSADLDEEDGFLVYEVTVALADGQEFDVFVDAGNKDILGVEKDDGMMG